MRENCEGTGIQDYNISATEIIIYQLRKKIVPHTNSSVSFDQCSTQFTNALGHSGPGGRRSPGAYRTMSFFSPPPPPPRVVGRHGLEGRIPVALCIGRPPLTVRTAHPVDVHFPRTAAPPILQHTALQRFEPNEGASVQHKHKHKHGRICFRKMSFPNSFLASVI